MLDKIAGLFAKRKERAPSDEERPVKMVQERENVWRVVYAD